MKKERKDLIINLSIIFLVTLVFIVGGIYWMGSRFLGPFVVGAIPFPCVINWYIRKKRQRQIADAEKAEHQSQT